MNETEKQELLKSISLEGAALDENKVNHLVLGSRANLNHIANHSSGLLRIYSSVAKKFILVISQPAILSALNPFEIRCVMCKRVISYPAWYYSIRYLVNHFHYFVCFDKNSPDKVNAKCYRRDV